jgi:hypothetical protein
MSHKDLKLGVIPALFDEVCIWKYSPEIFALGCIELPQILEERFFVTKLVTIFEMVEDDQPAGVFEKLYRFHVHYLCL